MLGIRHYKNRAIDLFQGDITTFCCDGMVNAANSSLSGGGGVDGAIHQKSGPELVSACQKIGSCQPGCAVITKGFNLPCEYVIHAVGPIWNPEKKEECISLLKAAYLDCFKLATTHKIRHLALSAISTGAYKFPIDLAAKVSMESIKEFIQNNPATSDSIFPERITWVLFSEELYKYYQSQLFFFFKDE